MSKKSAPEPEPQPAPKWYGRMQLVIEEADVANVDAWRIKQPDIPNRSEAIRRLIRLGLGVKR